MENMFIGIWVVFSVVDEKCDFVSDERFFQYYYQYYVYIIVICFYFYVDVFVMVFFGWNLYYGNFYYYCVFNCSVNYSVFIKGIVYIIG